MLSESEAVTTVLAGQAVSQTTVFENDATASALPDAERFLPE